MKNLFNFRAGFGIGLLTLLFLTAYLPIAAADFERLEPSPWTKEDFYMDKVAGKLGYGLENALLGWTALGFEPMRHSNKFTGLVQGLWHTLSNTVGGILHVGTFPFPFDIPLPDGGVSFKEFSTE